MEKIIKENFILAFQIDNDELLDGLIEYHKNNEEYKYRSDATHDKEVKDSTDVNIQIVSNNKFIKDYTNYLVSGLREYSKRYKHFNQSYLCIQEGLNIQHYEPNGGYKQWHNERGEHQAHQRALVWMTYLNDVPEGGETEFLYQNMRLPAAQGTMVIFPPAWTHPHRGNPPLKGIKYIITTWLEFIDTGHPIGGKFYGGASGFSGKDPRKGFSK